MSQPGEPLSLRALAKALGLDRRGVARDCARGMPKTVEGAIAWRLAYIRPREGTPRPSVVEAQDRVQGTPPKVVAFDYANPAVGDEEEDLAVCISRLRRLEKTCAQALERHLREGRVTEAQALRREHSSLIKSLFEASTKLIRVEEARGRLIRLDTALSMVSEALSAPVITLRRLPELAQTPEQRARLEAFLNAVLSEIQEGAHRSLERSACSKSSIRAS